MTPETAEKKAIRDYLRIKGYFVYHNLAGIGVYPGIADITAIKDGTVYQIEVKAGRGKQSPAQKEFQRCWEGAGGVYIIGGIDDIIERLCGKIPDYKL